VLIDFVLGTLFFSGYLIPKGWKVLPLFRNIHHSPENFKEPEKFDPSRFEVIIVI
jgi:(+)-abscisic acid 8'-hydroxylase